VLQNDQSALPLARRPSMVNTLSDKPPISYLLGAAGRRHVHTQIDSAELPVRQKTRRRGRPYTLVLTKTDELFTREKDARHKAVTGLAWLTSAWGDGPPGTSGLPGLYAISLMHFIDRL
jgi:hypothetical protein